MLAGWRLKLAPLWVPIAPAIFTGVFCFVIRIVVTNIADANVRTGQLSLMWQQAQNSAVQLLPDPVSMAILVYLMGIVATYWVVGKMLRVKALKEKESRSGVSSETSDLKREWG